MGGEPHSGAAAEAPPERTDSFHRLPAESGTGIGATQAARPTRGEPGLSRLPESQPLRIAVPARAEVVRQVLQVDWQLRLARLARGWIGQRQG
jgi:hypothetical protein